jgi:lycopene cyclase domain-containing protein
MSRLTYLEFLLVFVIPPVIVLGAVAIYRADAWWGPRPLSGLGIVLFLAFVYTTPWDNLLIAEGVWWYGDGATASQLWHAPVGEYLFFMLQPVLTAFWLFQFPDLRERSLRVGVPRRVVGAVAGLSVSGAGYLLLGADATFYLGAILLWAGPILAIQWGFGWSYVWEIRRTALLAVAVPTLYLCLIDRVAIGMGIWTISGTHTTGVALFGLPVEEAVFFLLTNVFVVQCLYLYMWLLDRAGQASLETWTATVLRRQPDPEVDQ